MNGNGNDFIIIFTSDVKGYEINSDFIVKLSDREHGVGCDQFILLSDSKAADIKMEIYNKDGSLGLACGNAARCVAWLISKDLGKKDITIKAANRILECQVSSNDVCVNMGKADFSSQSVALIGDHEGGYIDFGNKKLGNGYFVNVGNAHLIFFVDDINEVSVKEDLVQYESHSCFPNRINVSAVQLNGNEVEQVTYERGAGETLSCGTAACAVYAICREYKEIKSPLIIHQAGGTLVLSANDKTEIIMEGKTTFEYQDVISI